MATKLRNLKVKEVSLVDRPANPEARVVLFKRAERVNVTQKAEWTTADINNLPDGSFAYIEPGGEKDDEGKTTPRSLRHLPYKDKDGNVDAAHTRNALARLPQSDLSDEAKAGARRKLVAAAKEVGIEVEETKKRDENGLLARVIGAIGKLLGKPPEDVAKAMDEAVTYDEAKEEAEIQEQMNAIGGELWECLWSLQSAIMRTLRDGSVDREALIRGSLDQFTADVEQYLPAWLQGESGEDSENHSLDITKVGRKIAGKRLQALKEMRDNLHQMIQDAEAEPAKEGDGKEMAGKTEDQKMCPDCGQGMPKADEKCPHCGAEVNKSMDLAKRFENLTQQFAEFQKQADAAKAQAVALEKRATEAEAKLTKTQEDLAKAQGDLATERDSRNTAELAKRVETDLPYYPGATADKVALLKSLSDKLGAEEMEKQFAVMKAASEQIGKSGVFKEHGLPGKGAEKPSAEDRLDQLAKEYVGKGAGTTYAQVYDEVCKAHPELYAEYLAEQNAKGGK